MSLLEDRIVYKPFLYPWAYDSWLTQQRIHWLPEEVPLAEDVKDWHKTLTVSEKNLLTQIFRFFVQADVEVNNCYMKHYSQVFKPTEVQMMLSAFSNMETIGRIKDTFKASIIEENRKIEINILKLLFLFLGRSLRRSFKKNKENLYLLLFLYSILIWLSICKVLKLLIFNLIF